MAYSTGCLKFVVLAFSIIFAMSGLSIVVFCVANLVQFYTHRDFVPSSVSSPVLLLAFAGIAACCVAAMGWYGAMTGNTCRIFGFSVLLLMVVIVEFGASIWCLTSRADFHDTMAGSMEASFSAYKKDEAVVKKWDFLQRELKISGASDYTCQEENEDDIMETIE